MIAVVGANGQIGSWLIQCFRSWGEPVVAIHRRTLSPRLSRYSLDHRVADLRDLTRVTHSLEGCETVVNLAVERSGYPDPSDQVRANVEETENLVRACRQNRVARLIHVSSTAVLPPRVTEKVVSNPYGYSAARDGYTRSKIAAERVVRDARGDCSVSIVRPGIVYGPYLWWSAAALKRCQGTVVHLPSDSRSRCYAVHVLDVVRMLRHLVYFDGPMPELLYAINPEEVSWDDFYSQHCAHAGLECFLDKQPSAHIRWRALTDPSNLQWTILDLPPVQGAFNAPFVSNRIGTLYRIKRSVARIRTDKSGGNVDASSPQRHWWPTRNELELHSSSAEFSQEVCGGAVGFSYAVSLSRGCEGVGDWWNFAVDGMTPMERKLLDQRLRLLP